MESKIKANMIKAEPAAADTNKDTGCADPVMSEPASADAEAGEEQAVLTAGAEAEKEQAVLTAGAEAEEKQTMLAAGAGAENLDPEDDLSVSANDGDSFSAVVTAAQAGERIDRLLAACIPGQSRSYLKKLIKEGHVELRAAEGSRAVKPSTTVNAGEMISVFLPAQMLPDILPEDIPLDILYEDRDILVINKPRGMVVHPAAGHYTGTVVNAVLFHCRGSLSGINGVLRPGIVHRIDKDTTGSIIICKNDMAHRSIAAQLADHSIVRRYRAIVYGNIREDTLTIDQPIGRDPSDRKKMAVRPDGKRAVTHVRVLERFGDYTYVECRLETGRTHQIRVHMARIHHPLLGDTVYGSRKKSPFATQGQCLHARVLGFVHPVTGAYIETEAPLPACFQKILSALQSKKS